MNIIIFQCPIGGRHWHYAPEAALIAIPGLRMDDENGFDTIEQARAAVRNDPTIPTNARIKVEA